MLSSYPHTQARRRAANASLTLSGVLSSGLPELDRLLPGGGWPGKGTVELIPAKLDPVTPLNLLAAALTSLSWEDRWITLVQPPPLAPIPKAWRVGLNRSRFIVAPVRPGHDALSQSRIVVEAGQSAAVLVWPQRSPTMTDYAMLNGAAADRSTTIFLIRRNEQALSEPSGADLRVRVSGDKRGRLHVEIVPKAVATVLAFSRDELLEAPAIGDLHSLGWQKAS